MFAPKRCSPSLKMFLVVKDNSKASDTFSEAVLVSAAHRLEDVLMCSCETTCVEVFVV